MITRKSSIFPEEPREIIVNGKVIYIFPNKVTWFVSDEIGSLIIDCMTRSEPLEKVVEKIEKLDLHGISPHEYINSIIWKLKKLNFLSKDQEDCPVPDHLVIEITSRCNLRCKHCYQGDRESRQEMGKADIYRILAEVHKIGINGIIFTGGEPFLRSDLLDILKFSKKIGIDRITVITNGTLITEDVAKALKDMSIHVVLSLDGSQLIHDRIRGTGSYEHTLKGLETLRKKGVEVTLAFTILKTNLTEYEHIINVARKFDVRSLRFGVPFILGSLEKNMEFAPCEKEIRSFYANLKAYIKKRKIKIRITEFEIFRTQLSSGKRRKNCLKGYYYYINSNGEVFPCENMQYDGFKIGNILRNPLKELLSSPILFSLRKCNVDQIPQCSVCEFEYFCAAGCRGYTYSSLGTINAPNLYCNLLKDLYIGFMLDVTEYPKSQKNLCFNAIRHLCRRHDNVQS